MSGARSAIAWTIYDHPSDYPHCYVARKFALDQGDEPVPQREVMTSPALDAIRAAARRRVEVSHHPFGLVGVQL